MISRDEFTCTSSSQANDTTSCNNVFNADPNKKWITSNKNSWINIQFGTYFDLSKISINSPSSFTEAPLVSYGKRQQKTNIKDKDGWKEIELHYDNSTKSINISTTLNPGPTVVFEIRVHGWPGIVNMY